ncbi:MAG: hypothetical protein AB8G22_13345 [Saprospiraceae bacterium]
MKYDLEKIASNASLEIIENSSFILIKKKFRILNKFNFGILLYAMVGLFTIILSIQVIRESYMVFMILVITGLLLFGYSFIAMLCQTTDYILVTENRVKIRRKLKLYEFDLTSSITVNMKGQTKYVKALSKPYSGSYFRLIDIFINNGVEKFEVLDFTLDAKYTKEANILGSLITKKIRQKIYKNG